MSIPPANSPEDTPWLDDNEKAALRVFFLALIPSALQNQENLTQNERLKKYVSYVFPR